MSRPSLPPLRMALSKPIDDFDTPAHHQRQPPESRNGGHLSGRLSIQSVEGNPPIATRHSSGRPGDLSIYSLSSSPSVPKYPDVATSHNSISITGSSSSSPLLGRSSSLSSFSSGQDRTFPPHHTFPPSQPSIQPSSSQYNSTNPHVFITQDRRSSPEGYYQSPAQGFPSLFATGPARANPVGLSRQSSYGGQTTCTSQFNSPNSGRGSMNLDSVSSSSSLSAPSQAQNELPSSPRWVCDHDGCGKTFTRGFNLTQHKAAIHRDERRFECSYCTATFYRRNDLSRHERSHTGERPYRCECGLSFTRTDLLTRHKQYGNCSYYSS